MLGEEPGGRGLEWYAPMRGEGNRQGWNGVCAQTVAGHLWRGAWNIATVVSTTPAHAYTTHKNQRSKKHL